ncbi:MAG: hypothetical protein RL293_542 [Bacteroidota bacterium]
MNFRNFESQKNGMKNTQDYIQGNKDKFLNELIQLLRIPSVSADPFYSKDVAHCAEELAKHMSEIGLDAVEICPTAGHPIVYAEKMIDPSLPTILVYGHYDVQPADPIELWTSSDICTWCL